MNKKKLKTSKIIPRISQSAAPFVLESARLILHTDFFYCIEVLLENIPKPPTIHMLKPTHLHLLIPNPTQLMFTLWRVDL